MYPRPAFYLDDEDKTREFAKTIADFYLNVETNTTLLANPMAGFFVNIVDRSPNPGGKHPHNGESRVEKRC